MLSLTQVALQTFGTKHILNVPFLYSKPVSGKIILWEGDSGELSDLFQSSQQTYPFTSHLSVNDISERGTGSLSCQTHFASS